MTRHLIKIAYDGSAFHGWQVQHNAWSVQSELERAFSRFADNKPKLCGAGRTDTGVHALGQMASFDYEGKMSPLQIIRAFNRFLPKTVKVLSISETTPDFSARYDAYERRYCYFLAKSAHPFNRLYEGFAPKMQVKLDPMLEAAGYFLGTHDFSSFGKPNPEVPNRVCQVKHFSINEEEQRWVFRIYADRFLHNMVRRMVGALISISHHQLNPEIIQSWLKEAIPKQRHIYTAPASGLYLTEVLYPTRLIQASFTDPLDMNSSLTAIYLH